MGPKNAVIPSETNIFAPENGWLEYDPFLLGFGLCSGAKMLVSGRVVFGEALGLNLPGFPDDSCKTVPMAAEKRKDETR